VELWLPSCGRAKKSRQTNVEIKMYSIFRDATSPLRGKGGWVRHEWARPIDMATSQPSITSYHQSSRYWVLNQTLRRNITMPSLWNGEQGKRV